MTSMLFTVSCACGGDCGAGAALMRLSDCAVTYAALPRPNGGTRESDFASAVLRAIARRDFLFRGVLAGLFLGHLANHGPVAGHERRHLLELLAVPLLKFYHAGAFMIFAARLDRREQSRRAEFLDARFGEIQVLEAPAQLLGRHHLAFAELALRDAKRLDDDHSVHDAARVHHVAKTRRIFEIPFLRAVDLVLDVLHH